MATEKRLIWDEDAKRRIIALAVGHHTDTLPLDMIINAILHQTPTVDAVEVVHGRWEFSHTTTVEKFAIANYVKEGHYCPNCGADMRGEGNG